MHPVNAATASVVRDLIADSGRSEASIADAARIRPRTWSRRMAGASAFSSTELFRISTEVGVPIADIGHAITEKMR